MGPQIEEYCTVCEGTGRVPAVGEDCHEGETDFCVWCYSVIAPTPDGEPIN